MFKKYFTATILSFLFMSTGHAQLLDKIVAVFNDQTLSLSQLQRMHDNMLARQNISPQIYSKDSYTDAQLISKSVERLLIRERLSEMGYIVTDDQVESQIRATESRLGLGRSDLLQFLESNATTFDEYFEIIRETIEFNIFNSRIIEPLIAITEQEIKNAYYKENIDNQTVSFKYHLINFSIPSSALNQSQVNELPEVLRIFQDSGNLPSAYRQIQTSDLGQITEEGMNESIQEVVRQSLEGDFTRPIRLGDSYHVFYVKEREIVESGHFRQARPRIHNQLYQQAFERISKLWFDRQAQRHYVKINL